MLHLKGILLYVIFAAISLLAAGCALDRSDPEAVAESTFRVILAKDHQQLRQLVAPGGHIPSNAAWNDASFIRDTTPNEGIKTLWINGPIGGYTLKELTLEDWQGIEYHPEKLAQVHFILAGKSYVATFTVTYVGDKWSPGTNPISRDFLIRFEEL